MGGPDVGVGVKLGTALGVGEGDGGAVTVGPGVSVTTGVLGQSWPMAMRAADTGPSK
jgi:hypothetical protein